MSGTSKSIKAKKSTGKAVFLNFAVIVLINVITVFALCIFFYLTDRDIYKDFGLIIIFLSAADFLSAYYIGKKVKANGMLFGILYNLPLSVFLLLISLILNSFTFDIRIFIFTSARIILSAVGGITAVNTKSKRRRK